MPDLFPDNAAAIDMSTADLGPWQNATVEQVRDAILTHRIAGVALDARARVSTEPMLKSAASDAQEAVRAGRMIDAGFLPNAVIKAESKRAKDLIVGGWIHHPFTQPYVIYHVWEDGAAPLLVIPADEARMDTFVVELLPCTMRGHQMLMIGDVVELHPDPTTGAAGFRAQGRVSPLRLLRANTEHSTDDMIRDAACNCGDPVWTVLSMLATDGVEVETIPAPERLNRQRVAKGKHPIPSRMRVLSKPYVTAIEARLHRKPRSDGHGGTHASPVTHLRRGHLRRLPDGRQIWVRDHLVNAADGSPVLRSHYEVRR